MVTWSQWIEARRTDLTVGSHSHELAFVEAVLCKVKGLDPGSVEHEVGLFDRNGKRRRIDFVIEDVTLDRPIAIEVDGRDKSGRLPTHLEHDDFATRQNAVTRSYHLVRVTNNQVAHDPEGARSDIETALAFERAARLNRDSATAATAAKVAAQVAVTEVAKLEARRSNAPSVVGPQPPVRPFAPSSVPARASGGMSGVWWLVAAVVVLIVVVAALAGSKSGSGNDRGGGSAVNFRGGETVETVPPTNPPPTAPSMNPAALDPNGKAKTAYGTCPALYPVKANAESGIFHVPGQRYYERTDPERCFATPEDAAAQGFRASKV